MCGRILPQSCMAMHAFYFTTIVFVSRGKLGIKPMDFGLMCLSPNIV